jgi:LL-diaminopimelate aminotransferase
MSFSIDLSTRLEKLPPYLFVEVDKAKKELQRQGKDVIDLGVGDPDIPSPENVVRSLQREAEKKDNHRYASNRGLDELRDQIAGWYQQRFSVKLDAGGEILPILGSKEGIGHIPFALISSEKDIVLVPDPAYPVYNSGTILAGGTPFKMPLIKENGFLPDLGSIPKNILKKTRLMHINYPNNPTTAVATLDFFKDVVKFASRHNIIVCHDAAYSEMVFDDYKAPSFLEVEGAKDISIEFHSLSKTYNMTGWRIGFAVGNEKILSGLAKVKANMDSGIFQPIQYAGIEAMKLGDHFKEKINKVYKERRDAFVNGLRKAGIAADFPKATFYVWFPVPEGYTSQSFCLKILKDAHIILTPGNGFGEYGEGYARAALTVEVARINEAVERIQKVLK